uniref:Uncharacterized protein n=1 Tax=Sphaerodactylus townsendi TaxID=933632 RepID=A0ACB8E7Q1_9SAUR
MNADLFSFLDRHPAKISSLCHALSTHFSNTFFIYWYTMGIYRFFPPLCLYKACILPAIPNSQCLTDCTPINSWVTPIGSMAPSLSVFRRFYLGHFTNLAFIYLQS